MDLVFVVAGVAGVLLVGWLGIARVGERGRTAQCARNLALLGEGMLSYAGSHEQSLPPAYVWTPELKTTWDTRLMTILSSPSSKKDTRPALFVCPSDRLKRDSPRSYAMSQHDMKPENWPLGANNATGLGLAWTETTIKKYLPDNKRAEGPTIDELSLIKLSMILEPADTLLLSELISATNKFRHAAQSGLDGPSIQLEFLKGDGKVFHGGRFNYLMLDGHVELLSSHETQNVGIGDANWHLGIWTIKAGD
ncbi:MAG TPA: H-X9-DG-CTERM domain-containing protein [Verrucomicrobiae bacterium]|nr:H-X9-DG-CTERM domain-containing protein [Verrucomicrobiae bacterium]